MLDFGTVATPLGCDQIVDQVRTDLRMERCSDLLRRERDQLVEALGIALGDRRYNVMSLREGQDMYDALVKELENG
jgi:hypothetical protein